MYYCELFCLNTTIKILNNIFSRWLLFLRELLTREKPALDVRRQSFRTGHRHLQGNQRQVSAVHRVYKQDAFKNIDDSVNPFHLTGMKMINSKGFIN